MDHWGSHLIQLESSVVKWNDKCANCVLTDKFTFYLLKRHLLLLDDGESFAEKSEKENGFVKVMQITNPLRITLSPTLTFNAVLMWCWREIRQRW